VTYEDKYIRCINCGATFTFSAGEQEFSASRGLSNEPKRCRPCRDARDDQFYGGGERGRYHRILALTHLPKAGPRAGSQKEPGHQKVTEARKWQKA
jgi:hypothetical protein